jgi:hypothetical protein
MTLGWSTAWIVQLIGWIPVAFALGRLARAPRLVRALPALIAFAVSLALAFCAPDRTPHNARLALDAEAILAGAMLLQFGRRQREILPRANVE